MNFQRAIIQSPDHAAVLAALPAYEQMLLTVLRALVERFERHTDYPFVDTKLSMLTGQEFAPVAEENRDFKGPTSIFGWIQGRGLESLVGHARWLDSCTLIDAAQKADLRARLTRMIDAILTRLESIRRQNDGHVSFLMTPQGQPFTMGADGTRQNLHLRGGPYTTSDLFYAKGLIAAAAFLKKDDLLRDACNNFRSIVHAVSGDRLVSDQVFFDPKNHPIRLPGKFFHGSRMLSIGGLALCAEMVGGGEWFELGEQLIRSVMSRHINVGQHDLGPKGRPHLFDMCEAVDAHGQPWLDDGRVISDPGHACEFVGLAARLLLILDAQPQKTAAHQRLLRDTREIFPSVLLANFKNGHNPAVGGICKTFDLLSRKPINADLPWWNLPETIRAAAELLVLCPEADAKALRGVLAACSNGFMGHFVNPSIHLMAYQTLDPQGKPIDVIPATADADPGYHTGLSIIDFVNCTRKI